MKEKMLNKQRIICGSEGSGKTFFAENGKGSNIRKHNFVYNLGKEKDFENYELIELLTNEDALNYVTNEKKEFKKNPITLFEYGEFDEEEIFKLQGYKHLTNVKAHAYDDIRGLRDQEVFFNQMLKLGGDTRFIYDDATSTFKDGLSKQFKKLMTKKRHVENGLGINIDILVHELNKVSSDVFTYTHQIVMFNMITIPDPKDIDPKLKQKLIKAYEYLKTLPEYYSLTIDAVNIDSDVIITDKDGNERTQKW